MLSRRLLALLLLLVTSASASAQIISGPFTNPANNHRYYLVRIANYNDYTIAASGLGGYPAVINDAAENDFIRTTVLPTVPAGFDYAYLGLTDPSSTSDFRWSTGVLDSYTNWHAGEPNNSGGTERYGSIRTADATWNDISAPPADNGNGLAPGLVEANNASSGPTGILFGPVADPASGHIYYITTPAVWWGQEGFAERLGGHVAGIESAAEQSFIIKAILPVSGIGSSISLGINASTLSSPAFAFWYGAGSVGYSHYSAGEPNNPATEPIVVMTTTGTNAGLWSSATDTARSALIEIKRCPGDFNKNGTVEVQDIFDFLNGWFSGCP